MLSHKNEHILVEQYLDEAGNIFSTLAGPNPINQEMYGQPQGYKSLRPIHEDNSVMLEKSKVEYEKNPQPAYMNTNESDTSDSVKYYVLEDASKCN